MARFNSFAASNSSLIRYFFVILVSLSLLNNFLDFPLVEKKLYHHSNKSRERNTHTACAIIFNSSTLLSVISLLYSLQFQRKYNGSIHCVLIPTEPNASEKLKEILFRSSPNHLLTTVSYQLLNFSVYSSYQDKSAGRIWEFFSDAVGQRDHVMLSKSTNIMMDYFENRSGQFQYAFITNAENSYSPFFLYKTIANINESDLVITDMISAEGEYVRAKASAYRFHTEGTIFSMEYLRAFYSNGDYSNLRRTHVGVVHDVLFRSNV